MRPTFTVIATAAAVLIGVLWLLSRPGEARVKASEHAPSAPGVAPAPMSAADPRATVSLDSGMASIETNRTTHVVELEPVEAESPFTAPDSPELAYAWELARRPDAGRRELESAAEVFELCVKQVPAHDTCYKGLITAQQRLHGEDAGYTFEAPESLLPARPGTPLPPHQGAEQLNGR